MPWPTGKTKNFSVSSSSKATCPPRPGSATTPTALAGVNTAQIMPATDTNYALLLSVLGVSRQSLEIFSTDAGEAGRRVKEAPRLAHGDPQGCKECRRFPLVA